LDEATRAHISDRCNRLQTEMLIWGRGGIPTMGDFDGTLRSLIRCYQSDEDSPYHKLRHQTRIGYRNDLRRLDEWHGDTLMSDIKARMLLAWHAKWMGGTKVHMAHGLMGKLRTVIGFGVTFLEDDQCERLAVILHNMRFEAGKGREQHLTAEHAIAIRKAAHERGLPSIALAQAFQFECTLRQKDVIGEWVPMEEPGMSDEIFENKKWLRGLRWSSIDKDFILRHTTSKRQKDLTVDLKLAPMVMEELKDLIGIPDRGPVIIYEGTSRPYRAPRFRTLWREIAKAAKVPAAVYNMDTRAGAISEATDAGASLEDVRHAATHSNIKTTQGYSRGSTEKVAKVMQIRTASRNKK
jgi:hypothetical protein